MKTKPSPIDHYELEYRIVKARNVLHFLLYPKDRRDARKIFVMGHPRTGTGSLHQIFLDNGLRSAHTPGNWKTAKYDCFSDRGNYQPFALLDWYYRNALFILNTRPAFKYVRSRLNQTAKSRENRGAPRARFTVANIENEVLRRNRYFLRFIRHFRDRDNFLVVNIERQGALAELCRRLGFEYTEHSWNTNARKVLHEQDHRNIETAFENLGLAERKDTPFIIPELLAPDEQAEYQAFRDRQAERLII